MTLACVDGYQMEAHKVILASSSPFFQGLFKKIKHPHPMIYLKGFQPHDLVAVVDFLYCGKAHIFRMDLQSVSKRGPGYLNVLILNNQDFYTGQP